MGSYSNTVNNAASEQAITLHTYFHFLAISFLYYDHCLTFGDEVKYIWKRPKHKSAYWFLVNRYLSFFGNVVVSIMVFQPLSEEVCKKYESFRQILLVLTQIVVCILLTLRIHALYERDIRILALLLGSGLVLLGASCWSLVGQHSQVLQGIQSCHTETSHEAGIHLALAWEALFVYDSLIFSLIVIRTLKTRRRHAITQSSIPIISIVLRDGAMYFAIMALSNLSNLITFYIAGPLMKGGLSTFASSVSVTMISRLMLNLHGTAGASGIYTTGVILEASEYASQLLTTQAGDLPEETVECYDVHRGTHFV